MADETVQQDVQDQQSQEPVTQDTKPEYVSKGDYDKLMGEVSGLKESLGVAGQKLAVLDKVATLITGKEESTLSKEEQLVVSELKRLLPHALPNSEFLQHAPQLLKTVQDASKTAGEALVQAAYGYQLELQQEAGVSVDDPKANFYIGNAIKEYINQDPQRRARFWRGDRTVIQDGFKEVKDLFAPTKRADKRETVRVALDRPKNAAPAAAGAPHSNGETTPDFTDRKSVRAALRAALDS